MSRHVPNWAGASRPGIDRAWSPAHPSLLFCVSSEDRCPWKVLGGRQPVGSQTVTGTRGPDAGLGAVSTTDLRESTGPPLAPPTKRHCRSLSEPDGLARCRSPWRPGGSKVWTPVSKRRCHSGGSATPQESLGPGPTVPPAPQLPWASSGHTNGCESGPCPPWWRRLSLSQEHLAGLGTALASTSSSRSSTPELGRQLGLLRCRSQPCVLVGRRWRRRREERTRWPRPSLDFLKMTRVRLILFPVCLAGGTGPVVSTPLREPSGLGTRSGPGRA